MQWVSATGDPSLIAEVATACRVRFDFRWEFYGAEEL
jgi:hypothetical protein